MEKRMNILEDTETKAKLWRGSYDSTNLYTNLCDDLEYKYEFGRGTCWLGEKGLDYRYTNKSHIAQGWGNNFFKELTDTMRILAINSGFNNEKQPLFNHLLVNQYIGKQKLAMHKDNEPDLTGPIASLSLGATTKFNYGLSKSMKEAESISLSNGHILLGNREFFNNYFHSVSSPKITPITPVRYNLTWRTVKI